jgi:hypothetical protein
MGEIIKCMENFTSENLKGKTFWRHRYRWEVKDKIFPVLNQLRTTP